MSDNTNIQFIRVDLLLLLLHLHLIIVMFCALGQSLAAHAAEIATKILIELASIKKSIKPQQEKLPNGPLLY